MSKLISLIIATYNAEKYLQNCLDSITPQLTEKVELIIIDGGSKDRTLNIIKKNEYYISNWITEPDKGIYDAWNKGVKISKGEWIMFLGADDILLPCSISYYLNLIHSNDMAKYDYVSAHNEYIDNNGKVIKILGNEANWILMRKTMSAAHVGSLHNKKNLFEIIGYYNLKYKICADYELLLRKGSTLRAYFLNEKIAQMKVGGMSFSVQAIIETYKIRKEHKTINTLYNIILFVKDYLGFIFFKLRKSV